jgi:hypothetical protein
MKRKYSQPGKPLGKTAAKEKLLMRHKSGASSSLIFKNYSGQKPFHGVSPPARGRGLKLRRTASATTGVSRPPRGGVD